MLAFDTMVANCACVAVGYTQVSTVKSAVPKTMRSVGCMIKMSPLPSNDMLDSPNFFTAVLTCALPTVSITFCPVASYMPELVAFSRS